MRLGYSMATRFLPIKRRLQKSFLGQTDEQLLSQIISDKDRLAAQESTTTASPTSYDWGTQWGSFFGGIGNLLGSVGTGAGQIMSAIYGQQQVPTQQVPISPTALQPVPTGTTSAQLTQRINELQRLLQQPGVATSPLAQQQIAAALQQAQAAQSRIERGAIMNQVVKFGIPAAILVGGLFVVNKLLK